MTEAKKKEPEQEVEQEVKSYDGQLNDIDNQITELQAKKKELAKKVIKEMGERKEMPLHQLNAMAQHGYKEAKKRAGKKWVE